MPRARERMCLDIGLRLDINNLIRGGLRTGACEVEINGDESAIKGRLSAYLDNGPMHWVQLQFSSFDQTIGLIRVARHFGGFQWYFICPMTGDKASVLWLPRGQRSFASQKYWKARRKAYSSQFLSPHDRAEQGMKRIEARLVYDETDGLLYKPKRMRFTTYQHLCERLDAYDEVVNERLIRFVGRLMGRL
jgi:hypothetical protein